MLKAKKLLSLLVAGALAASMLTACAGSPASGTEGSTAGSTVSGETPPTVENKERVEITGMVQQSATTLVCRPWWKSWRKKRTS